MVKLLKDIISAVWNSALKPVLKEVVELAIDLAKEIFDSFIQELLRDIAEFVLTIIDTMEVVVKFFLGIDSRSLSSEFNLVEDLLKDDQMKNLVLFVMVISLALTTAFVTKKMHAQLVDDTTNQAPFMSLIKKIVKCWMRMGVTFIYCIVLINFVREGSVAITKITPLKSVSIANVFFVVGASDAIKSSNRNDIIEKYMSLSDTNHSFEKESQVDADFETKDINYLIIIILSIAGGWVFLKLIFMMSKRIFILAILYIIGPFFASLTLVEDDDKKYERWQNLFISEFMSVVILLIGYYIFTLMVYWLISFNIEFSDVKIINSVIELIVVIILLVTVPDSVLFAYNLVTDQGRFLAHDSFSIRELKLRNLMGLGG